MREWLQKLCDRIKMPAAAAQQVIAGFDEKSWQDMRVVLKKLRTPESWTEGLEELKAAALADEDGLAVLTLLLAESYYVHQEYQEKGISDTIFYETFACFSRFVKEYQESYGRYGFDRTFWVVRQLSLRLFRIGQLEFEIERYREENIISVHIPSDADIALKNCHDSYQKTRIFLKEFFPVFAQCRFFCGSWLLAPGLQEILPETSNIIQFQKEYEIAEVEPEADDIMQWVFKKADIPLADVPQDTSLQRKLKDYLQQGNTIGLAKGYLNFP